MVLVVAAAAETMAEVTVAVTINRTSLRELLSGGTKERMRDPCI